MMCDHYQDNNNNTIDNANDSYISIYQIVVKAFNSLFTKTSTDSSKLVTVASITNNVATENDKLEFEFENFIVSTIIWFIAILLFILVIALIILVFVNTNKTFTSYDDTDPFDSDLEKQDVTSTRLSVIEEETEDEEEEEEEQQQQQQTA
ncbi:hypothetical protein C6P45_004320 [Maudiozyma exigua]|uniref:Uncharacterized protein n=1 Tax=Maudiozyma exigua TaxID=34358 RepID=A0A9P7BBV1_MAUEX|nr:hypothetical protein C6P45_004320 [Kazachstania exigua]